MFTGEQAASYGLVTVAVPTADLDAELDRVVGSLVTGAPQGLRETKALLRGALERDLDEQRRLEREAQVRRFRAVAAAFVSGWRKRRRAATIPQNSPAAGGIG